MRSIPSCKFTQLASFRLLIMVSWLVVMGSLWAGIVVDEVFSEGGRSTQKPPDSLEWFAQLGSDTVTVAGNALTVKSSPRVGLGSAVAHFPPTTLDVGQSLIVRLDFNPLITDTAPASNLSMMSVGLFDSNAGKLFTADDQNFWVAYSGYAVQLAVNSGGESYLRIRKRAISPLAALILTSSPYATLRDGQPVTVNFTSGTTYSLVLSLTKVDNSMTRIEASVSGGDLTQDLTVSVNDKMAGPVAYDSIALTAHGSEKTPGFIDVSYSKIKLEVVSGQ